MTSHKNNQPGDSRPPDALELDLARLAREEAEDVARSHLMRPAPHEENILRGFRNQMEDAAHQPRSFRRWIWPVLAAASAAMIFAVAGPDFSRAPKEEDPWMGVGDAQTVLITKQEEGKTWFEWNFAPPKEGYFVFSLKTASGTLIATSDEIHESKWCYDAEENGSLPDNFTTEVSTWESINGLEELGEVYSQEFPSSR